MKKLNLFFQLSTMTILLVAGLFTFALAQNADENASRQKITVDVEVYEDGETRKVTKEIDASAGDDIHAILKDLNLLDEFDISGEGERIEIKVKKEVSGDVEREVEADVFHHSEPFMLERFEIADSRPLLGVFIESYNQNGTTGALVNGLVKESAAERAGLKENDVVVGVNEVEIKDEKHLRDVIATYEVGDEVEVKYLRDGVEFSKRVTLGDSKDSALDISQFGIDMDRYGIAKMFEELEMQNFDFEFESNRAFLGVTPGNQREIGVELGQVIEESAAQKMGLQEGDVILTIDAQATNSFNELAKIIQNKEVGEEVVIEFERNGVQQETRGALCERSENGFEQRIIRSAPHCNIGGPGPWAPEVVKEINVVIELKDCSEEEEEMLSEPANVDFKKSLALNKIEFAPNPSNGQFNLTFDLPDDHDTRIMVFDQTGRKVYEELLNNFDGQYSNQIDISSQPSGVYFLIIAQQDKQFTKKIVKQ